MARKSPMMIGIEEAIHFIRGQKVMLDADLARIYGVELKRLNEQVRRNAVRFPPDFTFQLTNQELTTLKSQIATSKSLFDAIRELLRPEELPAPKREIGFHIHDRNVPYRIRRRL